jgi:dienelactone hydrolase
MHPLCEAARRLSQNGIGVVRFDPCGCGNSFGSYLEVTASDWVDNMKAVVSWTYRFFEARQCISGGVRFGALTALAATVNNPHVHNVLLISPVVSGRRYLQELKRKNIMRDVLNGSFDSPKDRRNDTILDVQGYPITKSMVECIEHLDLQKMIKEISVPIAIIKSDMAVSDKRNNFVDITNGTSTRIVNAAYRSFWDYEDETSAEALANIIIPLLKINMAEGSNYGVPFCNSRRKSECETFNESKMQSIGYIGAQRERHFSLNQNGATVRGTIHYPNSHGSRSPIGAVFIEGGAGYSCGPHRILLDCARQFAHLGIPVIRHDSRGRGDSDGDISGNLITFGEILSIAVEDIIACADLFKHEFNCKELLLLGICAGGEEAFVAAESLRSARYIVAWSPFNSFSDEDHSVKIRQMIHTGQNYLKKLLKWKTLQRVCRREIDFHGVLNVIGNPFKKSCRLEANICRSHQNLTKPKSIFRGTYSVEPRVQCIKKALILYAGNDPLIHTSRDHYSNICRESDIELSEKVIPNCDHGFYSLKARSHVLTSTIDWVKHNVLCPKVASKISNRQSFK